VNFVGHIVVAERLRGATSTAHLLGAAAPDLARMARLPVADDGPADFRAGVAVHHRTDAVFHDLDWFRGHNRALGAELTARGVRRGPARGAAHVLVELLLDGALLADGRHAATFAPAWAALAAADDDAMAMVPAHGHARWREFLAQVTRRLDPSAYADAGYAADRTAGTLSWRPRLAMDGEETEVLREVAAEVQPSIVAEAEAVVRSVATVG
jgi:hypothetical protein